jgi:hypothetical protein
MGKGWIEPEENHRGGGIVFCILMKKVKYFLRKYIIERKYIIK